MFFEPSRVLFIRLSLDISLYTRRGNMFIQFEEKDELLHDHVRRTGRELQISKS